MTIANSSSENHDDRSWPPGFRFHPTDEELILYYLKRKICHRPLSLDIIGEVDVYKWDPEDLPGQSVLKTRDRQWFFFSSRDRKYPNGTRSNRATIYGYWKATGKDRPIYCNSRRVGNKKTLVFYRGRAPSGERTDWVMHEYTVDDEELKRCQSVKDYFVLYKLYKKSGPGPKNGEQYGAPFNEDTWMDGDPISTVPLSNNVNVDLENEIRFSFDETVVAENFSYYNPPREVLQSDAVNASIAQGATTEQYSERTHHSSPSQPVVHHLEHHIADQDFLEINDLRSSGSPIPSVETHPENLFFEDADDQNGFDLFQDAEMFLREMGPLDDELVLDPLPNDVRGHPTSELYQEQPTANTEQSGGEERTQADKDWRWFSSALWAFVDSIPTSPASAAESVLVNKALERISSFSGLKANAEGRIAPEGHKTYPWGKSMFCCFSLIAVLFATGWMILSPPFD